MTSARQFLLLRSVKPVSRNRNALPLLLCLASLTSNGADAGSGPAASRADYAKEIQPLLSERCYSCHGPEKQKGGLRLDRKSDAFHGGDNGKAIVPGKSSKSLLIQNVSGENPDTVMPPKGKRLTASEIERLRSWIDAGAEWPEQLAGGARPAKEHWAFKPPVRATVPSVRNKNWPRNSIDNFILSRLEKERIRPSPEADRLTLIRRLNFDLVGLPPTPDEVRQFVNDSRSDAYERLVDRLLRSPHFGERWARHWLDVARYADSDGYEKDGVRPFAYLYRDWVIEAINSDLPIDEFSIEQLAGDLLPHANLAQRTATGFHRQTLTNKEGGIDQEEFRCKATVDRATTTAAAWLGLTVGCAECHSHKYDPITQREFYQFYAFFNNASEKEISLASDDEIDRYERARRDWEAQEGKIKAALDSYLTNEFQAAELQWELVGA